MELKKLEEVELNLLNKISKYQNYKNLKHRHEDLINRIKEMKKEKKFYERIILKSENNSKSEEVSHIKLQYENLLVENRVVNKKLKTATYKNLLLKKKTKEYQEEFGKIVKYYERFCKKLGIKDPDFNPRDFEIDKEYKFDEENLENIKKKIEKNNEKYGGKCDNLNDIQAVIVLNKNHMKKRDEILEEEYYQILKFSNKNLELKIKKSRNKRKNSFKITDSSFSGISGSKSYSRLGSALFKLSKPGVYSKANSITNYGGSQSKLNLPRIYSLNENGRVNTVGSISPAHKNQRRIENNSSFKEVDSINQGKLNLENVKRHRRIKSNPGYSKEILENILMKNKKEREKELRASFSHKKLRPMKNSISKSKLNQKPHTPSSESKTRENLRSSKKIINLKKLDDSEKKIQNISSKGIENIEVETSIIKKKLEKTKRRSTVGKKNLKILLKSEKIQNSSKKNEEKSGNNDSDDSISESSLKEDSRNKEETSSLLKSDSERKTQKGGDSPNFLETGGRNLNRKKLSTIISRNELEREESSKNYKFISLTKNGSIDSNPHPDNIDRINIKKKSRDKIKKPTILVNSPGQLQPKNFKEGFEKKSLNNSGIGHTDRSKPIKKITIIETPNSSYQKLHNDNPDAYHIESKTDEITNSYRNFIVEEEKISESQLKSSSINRQTSIMNNQKKKKFNFKDSEVDKSSDRELHSNGSLRDYSNTVKRSRFKKKSKTKDVDSPNEFEKHRIKSILSNALNSPKKSNGKKSNVKFTEVGLKKTNTGGGTKSLHYKELKMKKARSQHINNIEEEPDFGNSEVFGTKETFDKTNSKFLNRLNTKEQSLKSQKTIRRIVEARSLIFNEVSTNHQDIYNPREGIAFGHERASKLLKNLEIRSEKEDNEFNLVIKSIISK